MRVLRAKSSCSCQTFSLASAEVRTMHRTVQGGFDVHLDTFWSGLLEESSNPVSKCSYKVAAQKTPGLLSSDLNEQRGPRTLPKTPYIQLQPAACPVISRLDGATVAQSSEA